MIHRVSDTRGSKRLAMVLRPSPQGPSTRVQEPVANVNGVHPGKTSQIALGGNQAGPDDPDPSKEKQNSNVQNISNGARPPYPQMQMRTNQNLQRPRASSRLTNGDHGSGELDNDMAPNMPGLDNQDNWQMRHGWEDQYNSEEYLSLLSSVSHEPPT